MKNAIKVLCFTLAVLIIGTASFWIYFKWDKTDFEYIDGTDKGTVKITGYKGEEKDIKIPDRLRGKKVTQIDSLAFEESDITSIEIGDNVTYIGKSVFRGCKSLKTVKLGNSVLNIDEGCFNDCPLLEEVFLPKSLEKLGGSIFAGCTAMKKVEVEEGGNFIIKDDVLLSADMKTIYFALPYAKLGNYTCPDTVEKIETLAFYNCESLTGFTFSNKIKALPQGVFVNCKNIKEISLPDSVTKIDAAVITNSAIKTITIPASVKEINKSAFVKSDGETDKELLIRTTAESKADIFAKENGMKVEYIK